MMLLKVIPILVGSTPLDIAIHAQTGFMFLSVMSIKALLLYIFCATIIARELRNTSFMNVSGSFRSGQ